MLAAIKAAQRNQHAAQHRGSGRAGGGRASKVRVGAVRRWTEQCAAANHMGPCCLPSRAICIVLFVGPRGCINKAARQGRLVAWVTPVGCVC